MPRPRLASPYGGDRRAGARLALLGRHHTELAFKPAAALREAQARRELRIVGIVDAGVIADKVLYLVADLQVRPTHNGARKLNEQPVNQGSGELKNCRA